MVQRPFLLVSLSKTVPNGETSSSGWLYVRQNHIGCTQSMPFDRTRMSYWRQKSSLDAVNQNGSQNAELTATIVFARPSDRLSVRPSVRPSDCSSVRPSFVRPSVRSSVRPSVRPFVRPSVYPSIRPSVSLPIRPSLCSFFVCPSVRSSFHPTVHPSVGPSIHSSAGSPFRPSIL